MAINTLIIPKLSPYYIIGFDTFTSTNIADRTWALDTRFHRTLTSSKAHKKECGKRKFIHKKIAGMETIHYLCQARQ